MLVDQDVNIIERVLQGDSQSFELLYKRYARFYMMTCLRYVRSKADAEDMVQEACIKIFRDLYQFDHSKSSFSSWSKRVVINTCLMHLRKKSVFNFMDNIYEIGHSISVRSTAIESLKLQDLTEIVQSLPKGYRTVFNLYVIDGYSHKEIAELLDVSESTSKTQLLKARKLLQKKLEEKDYSLIENYA